MEKAKEKKKNSQKAKAQKCYTQNYIKLKDKLR